MVPTGSVSLRTKRALKRFWASSSSWKISHLIWAGYDGGPAPPAGLDSCPAPTSKDGQLQQREAFWPKVGGCKTCLWEGQKCKWEGHKLAPGDHHFLSQDWWNIKSCLPYAGSVTVFSNICELVCRMCWGIEAPSLESKHPRSFQQWSCTVHPAGMLLQFASAFRNTLIRRRTNDMVIGCHWENLVVQCVFQHSSAIKFRSFCHIWAPWPQEDGNEVIRLKNGQVLHLDVRDDIRENDEEQIRYTDCMTSSSLCVFCLFEDRAVDLRRTSPLSWLRMILVVLFVETSEPLKAVGTCWFGSWGQTSIGDCHRVLLAVVAWLCSEWVPLCWNSCRRPFRHDLRRGQKVWSDAWRTTVALVQKSWDGLRFSAFSLATKVSCCKTEIGSVTLWLP